MQQVGLAEPGRGVEEQRVVGLAGQLGDRQRRGVGESVAVADDELVEAVARVERARVGLGAGRLRWPPRGLARGGVAGERDLDRGSEDGAGAALDDPAEALGDPACVVRGAARRRIVALSA